MWIRSNNTYRRSVLLQSAMETLSPGGKGLGYGRSQRQDHNSLRSFFRLAHRDVDTDHHYAITQAADVPCIKRVKGIPDGGSD